MFNLSFSEPNNERPASLRDGLNLITSFVVFDVFVFGALVSSFKMSNVKKSENGALEKLLLSFSGVALSIAKLVLVNWLLPSVIWIPTKLSLKVCTPLAAWLGTFVYFAIIRQ